MASLTQFSLLEALAFGFKSPDSIVAGISSSAARSSFCTSWSSDIVLNHPAKPPRKRLLLKTLGRESNLGWQGAGLRPCRRVREISGCLCFCGATIATVDEHSRSAHRGVGA
jgi:hypothetical protein